jgi:hypothetical protein
MVSSLGREAAPDPNLTVMALHSRPREAVLLLVRELHPVDPDFSTKTSSEDALHVIWCIRALRSITGEDVSGRRFLFRTEERLTDSQREFLHQDKPLPFFAEWMSHAKVYLAPRDVQTRVVAAWQAWVGDHLHTFKARSFESYGAWYW